MRVAIGGILHESNTFAAASTPLAAFTVRREAEIAAAYQDTDHEVAGFLQGAGEAGLDLVPTLLAGATPAEGFPDGDGEVVRRVREALGPEMPIVATHDFHANISDQVAALTTALVVYKTNPHVDQRERGAGAAHLMARLLRGELRPAQA